MTKKRQNILSTKLDAYEKEIEDALPESLEDLHTTKNAPKELSFAKKASANYLRKHAKINIKLSLYDVEGLRRLAAREGIPYQTLIASILHKYITQHL